MYLAIVKEKGITKFVLRYSTKDSNLGWISRDIIDLGRDPEKFVEYIDERIFYISEQVQEAVSELGINYEYEELEEIFWPFIDPDIKQRIDDFGGIRGRAKRPKRRYNKDELREMQKGIHPFDKRRMLFLKFLQINLGPLMEYPLPFLNKLLNKSRDEIEQGFKFMELELRPWEMKGYLYAVFGLADKFAPRLSRFIPEAQDQTMMDEFFLEELCNLNSDPYFLNAGARPQKTNGLHPYLRRYLIQYFDHSFVEQGYEKWQKGANKWQDSSVPSDKDLLSAMELTKDEFDEMSKKDFVRYFRKKAKTMHPDKGGDHHAFIRLKEAFEILILKKKW